ncbi:hypothetical protein JOM56_000916 [Amanita muscaria]
MAAVRNSSFVEEGEEETPEMTGSRKTNAKPKSKRKTTTTKSAGGEKSDVASNGRALDGNLLRLLRAHEQGRCLEAEKNDIYGNVEIDSSDRLLIHRTVHVIIDDASVLE